ncbi:MAG TPA: outer membrane protein assembly factor BamD [Bacteroidetes bacterium]|nr:outer membrane protein assembly factor BamD [Bacteroidota bacterium]
MKKTIITLAVVSLALALIIGCQKGPKAEDLFTEAKKLQEEQKYDEAVVKYEQLVELHPKSQYAPQSQFMIGFIYANEIEDLEKAKVAYETFLNQYADRSDSGMVASAEWELKNLGKDINEITDLSAVPEEGVEEGESEGEK